MTAKRTRIRKGIAVFLITALVSVLLPRARAQIEITLPETHPAYSDMAQLAAGNLVPGYEADDFERSAALTREDFARAVIAAQEFYNLNPDRFSPENIARLESLKSEFRAEIEQLGGVYERQAAEAPPEAAMVPTTHWAYDALGGFAERGLFPGLSGDNFSGGRVYSRAELAALAARIIEMARTYPEVFSGADRETVAYLEQEFRDEIAAARAPFQTKSMDTLEIPEPAPEKKEAPGITGTSNVFVGVTKGNKSSFTNRVTLETNGGRLQGYMSGDVDNAARKGAAVNFGQGYTFEVTRRVLGWHTRPEDPENDSYVTAGNITGIDFGSGLTVGAASVRGAYASVRAGRGRLILLGGDDNDGRPVAAARYAHKTSDTAAYALTLYRQAHAAGAVRAAGVDYDVSAPSRRLSMEYTHVQGAGRGLFMRLQRDFTKSLRARFEFRNYRDFVIDNNNPPRYLGRSGGDEENEKSAYLSVQWKPRPRWTLIASRDHIYSPALGRRTGSYAGAEWQPNNKWLLGAGLENERGGAAAERERSMKLRYAVMRDIVLTGSWKRNTGGSSPSSTTRVDVTLPVISDAAKMIVSATRRRTRARRANSYRLRISGPTGGAQASLSFDYAPTGANRFDVSLTWKF